MSMTVTKHRVIGKSWLCLANVIALLLVTESVELDTQVDTPPAPVESETTQKPSTPQSSKSFNELMTAAHRHLEQSEWSDAVQALKHAIQKQPNSTAAQELLKEAELEFAKYQQTLLIAAFETASLQEQWVEAATIADNLTAPSHEVSHAIERVRQLSAIELELDQLLVNPDSWTRPHTQDRIDKVFDASGALDVGLKIEEKLSKLHELNTLWNIPVQVTLKSDKRSSVLVHPGKALGKFRQLTVELKPGKYRFVARRQGFREVIRQLVLKPGDTPQTIDIQATERF